MASPLHWFRKRQKLLLGISGVALIFVFTISLGSGVDPLIDLLSGNWHSADGKGPMVVSWRDGEFREGDLESLRMQRRLAAGYLYNIYQTAIERGAQPREDMINTSVSDESLLELELLSEQAAKMGIQISNEDIKDYLMDLTDDRIKEWELSDIWQRFTGQQYSDKRLFDLLRRELAAHRAREMLRVSGELASPVQLWDLFNRMERQVTVELMPIEVDTFLDKVPSPTDAELQEFFETYKSRYPFPNDPTPGFRQRERRAFEFIRFDFEPFLEDEAAKIRPEEVRKYYEQNREEFIQTKLPASDLELEQQPEAPATPAPDHPGTSPAAEVESASEVRETAPEEPSAAVKPTQSDADADRDASETESDESAAKESDAPAAKEEGTEEPTEQPDSDGQAPTPTQTPQPQQEDPAGADEAPAGDTPPKAGDTPQDQAGDQSGEKAGDTAPQEQPAGATGQPAEDTRPSGEGEKAAETPSPSESGGEGKPAQEAAVSPQPTAEETPQEKPAPAATAAEVDQPTEDRYQPLDEVEAEIRRRLAFPKAQKRLDEIIAKTQQQLGPYLQWQASHQNGEPGTPPEVDLAAISAKPPLHLETIPLSDEIEIQQHDLGRSTDSIVSETMTRWIPFGQFGYDRSLIPFQAKVFPAQPYLWPKFLFWVTRTEPAYEPSLAEIRDEVEVAWKRRKALELALAEAEADAAKAREAGKPLSESLVEAGSTFLGPVEVRWMTPGNLPAGAGGMPQLAEIPGVEGTTEDMLRSIFRMADGDVAVLTNAPKTVVYVVRAVASTPPQDELYDRFLHGSGIAQEIRSLWLREMMRDWRSTYFDVLQKEHVEWLREPANPTR